jgi:hypothetical protein
MNTSAKSEDKGSKGLKSERRGESKVKEADCQVVAVVARTSVDLSSCGNHVFSIIRFTNDALGT